MSPVCDWCHKPIRWWHRSRRSFHVPHFPIRHYLCSFYGKGGTA